MLGHCIYKPNVTSIKLQLYIHSTGLPYSFYPTMFSETTFIELPDKIKIMLLYTTLLLFQVDIQTSTSKYAP